jgi:hypothetical protein
MNLRNFRLISLLFLALAALGPGSALAQYRYGGGGAGGSSHKGFLVQLDALLSNPRNADNVVATEIAGSSLTAIIPVWSEDPAGRLLVGYEWSSGQSVTLGYGVFETTIDSAGTATGGGVLAFAVGPPVASGGGYVGDVGSRGFYSIETEIIAETGDLAWARRHAMSDSLALSWGLGLRWASFEETHQGLYAAAGSAVGANGFAVFKTHTGEMLGVRARVRGEYRVGRFAVGGGLAFSMLDGEIDASSSLDPNGTSNGAIAASSGRVFDDGRSGTIRDFDVVGAVFLASDAVRISLGWEQSEWRDIAADVLRNFPGTAAPLRDRDAVVLSGIRLGVQLRF